jgi:signal transduction histidine kinase
LKPTMKSEEPPDDAILAAIEHERHRIGTLLHESLCQALAGVTIQLEVILRRAESGKVASLADLTLVRDRIHEAIDTTRSISGVLRAVNLGPGGLMEALGHLTDAAAKTMPCEYLCEQPVYFSDAKEGLALLRIAEEALANAHKHAGARRIIVSLSQTARAINLRIEDDGKGFLPGNVDGRSSGLNLMRRRARAVGATLEIESTPRRGTVVFCSLAMSR